VWGGEGKTQKVWRQKREKENNEIKKSEIVTKKEGEIHMVWGGNKSVVGHF